MRIHPPNKGKVKECNGLDFQQLTPGWHQRLLPPTMKPMKPSLALLLTLLIFASPLSAQAEKPSTRDVAEPDDVTYCELSRNPAAYNRQLVRLTAFVTHGFEDFGLADPACHTQGFSVWVMYGGNAQSNTMYCCPGEAASKTRPGRLTIDGLEIPLVDDVTFKRFTDLLAKEKDTTVRLTAIGRFFSAEKQTVNGQTRWQGFGHLGCCSLFVVQRVESFEPHTRSDLDYTSEAGWYENEGCKHATVQYKRHVSLQNADEEVEQAITEQRRADNGESAWAFGDPQRVAIDSLKPYYPDQVPVLRSVKKTPYRYLFRWKKGKGQVVIVVSRPYWLSSYAKSPSVVWVSTMIKEAGCD